MELRKAYWQKWSSIYRIELCFNHSLKSIRTNVTSMCNIIALNFNLFHLVFHHSHNGSEFYPLIIYQGCWIWSMKIVGKNRYPSFSLAVGMIDCVLFFDMFQWTQLITWQYFSILIRKIYFVFVSHSCEDFCYEYRWVQVNASNSIYCNDALRDEKIVCAKKSYSPLTKSSYRFGQCVSKQLGCVNL